MSLRFLQAPILGDGVRPNHRHMNALADSVNSRLRSGVGNSAWRIAYAAAAFTRQIRNPAQGAFQSVWPPQDEWLKLYAHSRQSWTVAGPGDYEGLNVNSPLPAFVYGNESVPVDGEDFRLSQATDLFFDESGLMRAPIPGSTQYPRKRKSDLSGVPVQDVSSPGDVWYLGKLQRGLAVDASNMVAPALLAAESHFAIAPNHISKMGVTFGGFVPTPRVIGSCSVNWQEQDLTQFNYQFRFSALKEGGQDIVVNGFCPGSSLSALYEWPTGYYLVYQNGQVSVLPYEDYLLVLDGSGRASNQPNPWFGQGRMFYWDIAFGRWCQAFRGSRGQIESASWNVRHTAFEFEAIGRRNYLLAPMKAVEAGDGTLKEAIPAYVWTDGVFGFSHSVSNGFVVTAMFVDAYDLEGPLTVRVKQGNRVVAAVTLTTESSEAIRVFQEDLTGSLTVEAVGEVASSLVRVELLEQLDRLPELRDLYLLTRLGCAGAPSSDVADLMGEQVESPKDVSTVFRSGAAIVNGASGGLVEKQVIVDNGIYEAARRQINENVKYFPREALRSYETIVEEGVQKSVLVVDRYPLNPNDRLSQAFEHMGPSDQVVSSVKEGWQYVVDAPAGGWVVYDNETYEDKDTFTGQPGVTSFDAEDATVYEWEGIRSEAGPEGLSNEWVVFFSWMPYGVGDPWHPEQYGDLLGHLNNPAHLWNEEMRAGNPFTNPALVDVSKAIRPGLANGHSLLDETSRVFYAECPDGWNFAKGSNAPSDAVGLSNYGLSNEEVQGYFKSLQIYQDPYEVESITPIRRNGKWDQMRVVLKSRLRPHERSLGRNFKSSVDSWYVLGNVDWLRAEAYATDENRMLKYFLWRDRGEQFDVVLGDTAISAWQSRAWPDAMRGCILPRMHAVRLVSKVWVDDNDRADSKDTRLWCDSFLQLAQYAPMAEGFIDSAASLGFECNIGSDADGEVPVKLFDFTIPEWCRQAFGKRFFEFMLSSERRGDQAAAGAGPLPGVRWTAEHYNQFAQAFNTLIRARIELPLLLESREVHTSGVGVIQSPEFGDAPAETNLPDGARTSDAGGWVVWSGSAPTLGESSTEFDWFNETADRSTLWQGYISFSIGNFMVAKGGRLYFAAVGSEIRTEWRINEVQHAYLALPEDLRGILATQASLLVKVKDQVVSNSYTATPGQQSKGRTTEFENGVQVDQNPYQLIPNNTDGVVLERRSETSRVCLLSSGGLVIAPVPHGALVYSGGQNYGLVSSRRTVWPIGTQIGAGNLFVTVPQSGIVV